MLLLRGHDKQVGAGVDPQPRCCSSANPRRRVGGSEQLPRHRVLVLDIDAHRARRCCPRDRRADFCRASTIASLHVDGNRQVSDRKDPLQIFECGVEGQSFAILEPERTGNAPASRRNGLRPGIGHRPGAARIPDIV